MTVVLGEGDACLLSDREFDITEIPLQGLGWCETHFFFFGDRVLSDILARSGNYEEIIAEYWFEPMPLHFIPRFAEIMNIGIRRGQIEYPKDFNRLFCLALRQQITVNGFLKYGYLKRALELRDFLNDTIRTPVSWSAVEEAYPGGKRCLRATCRLFFRMTPQQWHYAQSNAKTAREAMGEALMAKELRPARPHRSPKKAAWAAESPLFAKKTQTAPDGDLSW